MGTEGKRLIVVLGMHRSGTSAVTRALQVFGIDLGDRLMQPSVGDNDKGFYEDTDLYNLNVEMLGAVGKQWDSLSPLTSNDMEILQNTGFLLRAIDLLKQKTAHVSLFAFKDPRVTKLLPFWQSVFAHGKYEVTYVLVVRNPLSVARSLKRRDGFPHVKSYLLWLGHVVTSCALTRGHDRLMADFDNLLTAPRETLALISRHLSLRVDENSLNEYLSNFLEAGLRHNVCSIDELAADPECPALVENVYSSLQKYSTDNSLLNTQPFYSQASNWVSEVDRLEPALRWIDQLLEQQADFRNSINAREAEIRRLAISTINKTGTAFQKSFDAAQYRSKNPDVAAAGVDPYQHLLTNGIVEGRLSISELFTFLSDSLRIHCEDLTNQLNHTKAQHESSLLKLSEFQKDATLRLRESKQLQEQLVSECEDRLSTLERSYSAHVSEARALSERQRLELIGREQAHSDQISKILVTHEKQQREQAERHEMSCNVLREKLACAQRTLETMASEQLERESKHSTIYLEMVKTHETQVRDQANRLGLLEQELRSNLVKEQLAAARLSVELAHCEAQLKSLMDTVNQKDADMEKLRVDNAGLNELLRASEARISCLDGTITELNRDATAHQTRIAELSEGLERLRQTISWRATAPIRQIAGWFGSGRS